MSLQNCVAQWYATGLDAPAGATYHYGPVHMQVAAAMAEIATGQPWADLFAATLANPLRLADTGFPDRHPRASGSASSSALDYARFLQAQLTGELLGGTFAELASQRTTGVKLSYRPQSIASAGDDWQYGLGVWRECAEATWSDTCEARTIVSSPGAFGWYPFMDVDNGYYVVLAMRERRTLSFVPAAESVQLGQQLRPLILEALD